jgi:hypothetical protein
MSLSSCYDTFIFQAFSRATLDARKDKLRDVFKTPSSFLQ